MVSNYLFDNAAEGEARARMTALAQHNDATFRHLENAGLQAGGADPPVL